MIKTDEFVTAEVRLYYDLYLPETATKPAPLLIAIHGYAAHKRYMMREAQLVAPEGFAIASLEAPNRFWHESKKGGFKPVAGWLTDHRAEESVGLHREFLLKVIRELADSGVADPESVFLLGFSQSCALNFRFAFTEPGALKGVVGLGGGIPSDLDTNDAYSPTDADVLYLYTKEDEFYPLDKFEEFAGRLAEYLASFESRVFEGGHEITDEMREVVRDWLGARS